MNLFDEYRGGFQHRPHQPNELPIIDHTACTEGDTALDNGDVDLAIRCFTRAIAP